MKAASLTLLLMCAAVSMGLDACSNEDIKKGPDYGREFSQTAVIQAVATASDVVDITRSKKGMAVAVTSNFKPASYPEPLSLGSSVYEITDDIDNGDDTITIEFKIRKYDEDGALIDISEGDFTYYVNSEAMANQLVQQSVLTSMSAVETASVSRASFHGLVQSIQVLPAPIIHRSKPDCGDYGPSCTINTRAVEFDIVLWRGDDQSDRFHYEFHFSNDLPPFAQTESALDFGPLLLPATAKNCYWTLFDAGTGGKLPGRVCHEVTDTLSGD